MEIAITGIYCKTCITSFLSAKSINSGNLHSIKQVLLRDFQMYGLSTFIINICNRCIIYSINTLHINCVKISSIHLYHKCGVDYLC